MEDLIKAYKWSNSHIVINRVSYFVPDFCLLIIKHKNQKDLAKFLGCSGLTIQRNIDKYIPELSKFKRPRTPLDYRVFSLFEYKYCTKCSLASPKTSFSKNKAQPDGLHQYCTSCTHLVYEENKEVIDARNVKWRKENPGKVRAGKARRRAAELNQCPEWANLLDILDFYEGCPPGHEVDHIIPLRGKKVSGLHVLNNLQYLTKLENQKKSNRFEI